MMDEVDGMDLMDAMDAPKGTGQGPVHRVHLVHTVHIVQTAFFIYSATTQPSGPLTKRAVVMSFLRPVRGTVMSSSTSQT